MRTAVRYLAYPLILGTLAVLLVVLADRGVAYWPAFPVLVVVGIGAVAVLERLAPYEPAWNRDHGGDTRVDVLHLLVSHALIQGAVASAFGLRALLPDLPTLWPSSAPMWAQILLAGGVMDLGLYAMHRASHISGFLWRLHAIHHMPERLYWLNGGRRHPLSALVLAGPGLIALLVLGATPIALGAWLSIMSIHLAFQHANLDYRLGPFRHVLGVGEMHRWHHEREFEDAQVNFGEVFLIWDLLFGTHHDAPRSPARGEVGLKDDDIPATYLGQILWPMRKR
ncbi:sterol desaturase family protein [Hydrocarboniphaga sp.]|uniref:sterol desaturase family protein n=1 Tax=Hydrocarboniphaga sp. TaxID=2033016 RepID=UPI002AB9E79E|nr:sterol desaturase family protein [Hydrocarboniphaga sp.]MDZ4079823.1 sterol desaturase family protein [Hydrocarboniphaga sp.]